jgi:molybdopterin molybdotransferase
MLVELARRESAHVRFGGILRDERDALREALATAEADVSITSGSSSKGAEDMVPRLLGELGELWVHGVAIRPGHPVGFGRVGERLHFALPGNPVAAWVCFRLFVRPALRLLSGLGEREAFRPERTVRACLTQRVTSALGRTDVVRVRSGEDGTIEPLGANGAGRLTTLTRADGFFVVPPDVEAMEAGTEVEVELL